MKKGIFIVIDGIDGTGKTTQAGMLAQFLSGRGCSVLLARDPGGTELGEGLRDVLLHSRHSIDPVAEALMFAAARAQHVGEKILPALQKGWVVVSDRFADSMCAYQGAGKGVSVEFLELVNSYSCRGIVPDIIIILDLDPVTALSRMKRPADRMESEGAEFLSRVRKEYLARAERYPDRYIVLDGSMPVEELFSDVKRVVERLISST
ncbi:MAG: dTMP kinase [Bacillota bacterium]